MQQITAKRSIGLDTSRWGYYKKSKFDHRNKWYMHNPEFHLENAMFSLNFKILTYSLIPARQPD